MTLASPIERVKRSDTIRLLVLHGRGYVVIGWDKPSDELLLAPADRVASA